MEEPFDIFEDGRSLKVFLNVRQPQYSLNNQNNHATKNNKK
jgi:hypothetical protein